MSRARHANRIKLGAAYPEDGRVTAVMDAVANAELAWAHYWTEGTSDKLRRWQEAHQEVRRRIRIALNEASPTPADTDTGRALDATRGR